MCNLTCIKCKEKYQDTEPDDFYCPSCNKERLKIAKEVDRKIAMQGPREKPTSDFQRYEELRKQRGGSIHINIKDMGITL